MWRGAVLRKADMPYALQFDYPSGVKRIEANRGPGVLSIIRNYQKSSELVSFKERQSGCDRAVSEWREPEVVFNLVLEVL
jgi:hypothetical protein